MCFAYKVEQLTSSERLRKGFIKNFTSFFLLFFLFIFLSLSLFLSLSSFLVCAYLTEKLGAGCISRKDGFKK